MSAAFFGVPTGFFDVLISMNAMAKHGHWDQKWQNKDVLLFILLFEAKHKPHFKMKYKTSKQCGTHSHSFHFCISGPETDTEHREVTLL